MTRKIAKVFVSAGSDVYPTCQEDREKIRDIIAEKLDLSEDDVFVVDHTIRIVVQLEDGEFVQVLW